MGAEDLPAWAQGFANLGVLAGAVAAVAYGYFRASSGRASEIRVAGGIVDPAALKPLIDVLLRLSEAIEKRVEQWEEREAQERSRAHAAEIAALRKEIEALKHGR